MVNKAFALALLLALSAPLAAQETWTVDDDGPADFATIQAAVDAAADGDVIVVRAGFYERAAIKAKGLMIQADGHVVLLVLLPLARPTLEVRDLGSDQAVYVRGLVLDSLTVDVPTTLIESCAGPVLLEDCTVEGSGTPVSVRSSASATFSRCELVAPPTSASSDGAAYAGFEATDSSVYLYDCSVAGSTGEDAHPESPFAVPPAASAPGVSASGSTLLVSGSLLHGGNGGGDPAGFCFPGEAGSPGLLLQAGPIHRTSTAYLLDSTVLGGTGGVGGCGNPPGVDGPAIDAVAGEAHALPGTARSFSGASPVVEGSSTAIHLAGEPGDAVILHVQVGATPGLYLPQYAVALHLPLPVAVVGLGSIPASGVLDVAFPVPALPPGVESFRAVGQALFVGATGFFDGGPSTLLIVDTAL
jgi:hypothetical protein